MSEAISCRPGDILWLPLLDDLEEDFDIDDDYADYEELMFGRPVLILRVDAANTVATFCTVNFLHPTVDIPLSNEHQITSFGGYGLIDSQYADDYDRGFFVPISPATAHPDHDLALALRKGDVPMEVDSWANTIEVHDIDIQALDYWRGTALNDDSLRKILNQTGGLEAGQCMKTPTCLCLSSL
ncbi:hypothetical protein LTS18_013647 [Coniosporium uncinatum]|uniref:Uncharacterized protein n=1 Tax=Coniosporium uncinatum TaxID=93489 RepID=A0ACC3CWJ0_9PEZI|nr:hypothetical protein LTS18_013647 [Coniosporium uncinatum]